MTSIKQALYNAINKLTQSSLSAPIDAEVLLCFVLKKSRSYLYTHPEKLLNARQQQSFEKFVAQRAEGVPIAYLTGQREFWSLKLQVSTDTLIPRSETELMVELTLDLLKNKAKASLIDLGTGSGAIALALAHEKPDWQLLACDINQAALEIAQKNATKLKITNIQFCCSNWFTSISNQKFHAILSNPPYLSNKDPHSHNGDLRFEPKEALISDENGLQSLHYIIKESYHRLYPGGLLLLEHGFKQKKAVTTMLKTCGYERINSWQDIQGHDRVSGGWHQL